jgi:hypothetical protein
VISPTVEAPAPEQRQTAEPGVWFRERRSGREGMLWR